MVDIMLVLQGAQFMMERIINMTPTGNVRNRLTEINMDMMVLLGEMKAGEVKPEGPALRLVTQMEQQNAQAKSR